MQYAASGGNGCLLLIFIATIGARWLRRKSRAVVRLLPGEQPKEDGSNKRKSHFLFPGEQRKHHKGGSLRLRVGMIPTPTKRQRRPAMPSTSDMIRPLSLTEIELVSGGELTPEQKAALALAAVAQVVKEATASTNATIGKMKEALK